MVLKVLYQLGELAQLFHIVERHQATHEHQ
jgi:hypothetical protein